jgi:hypothetical protein
MKITPYERAARLLTKSETQVRSDTDLAIAILGATNCSGGAGQGFVTGSKEKTSNQAAKL